eukprot:TRINITY_DN6434_c0_g1_i3.p1 TRINITY_DN6434_c0_g1~~TRINITY_DN6434_c0_g1_i3.p1  ORF type:complete len:202 (-),score=44.01 TRINITY_DN6434_c0_g1_i3:211-816(-)
MSSSLEHLGKCPSVVLYTACTLSICMCPLTYRPPAVGGGDEGGFALHLDSQLCKGSSAGCQTFQNPDGGGLSSQLSGEQFFTVRRLELWTFVSSEEEHDRIQKHHALHRTQSLVLPTAAHTSENEIHISSILRPRSSAKAMINVRSKSITAVSTHAETRALRSQSLDFCPSSATSSCAPTGEGAVPIAAAASTPDLRSLVP